MHPARRQIIFRWILYTLALASLAVWWWLAGSAPDFERGAYALPEVPLPAAADLRVVARGVDVLEKSRNARGAKTRAVSRLLAEPRTQALKEEHLNLERLVEFQEEQAERRLHLSLLFFSKTNRMAVIDGRVVREGSPLRDGSRVLRIERDGVLVGGRGASRRLPWTPPGEVRLERGGL